MKTKAISINPEILFMSVFHENKNDKDSDNHYIPGACNIGHEEIQRRIKAGWSGLILTIITATLLLWLGADRWWRLLIFIPAMMGATGFIQAYSKFCVYFGFGHLFNFGETGKTDTVEQVEFRAKDRAKAWQVIGYSVGVTVVVTLLFYFIPV